MGIQHLDEIHHCIMNLLYHQVCTGHLLAVVSLHYQPVKVLKFTWDGVHLLSGGDDGRVVVWRLARYPTSVIDRALLTSILTQLCTS